MRIRTRVDIAMQMESTSHDDRASSCVQIKTVSAINRECEMSLLDMGETSSALDTQSVDVNQNTNALKSSEISNSSNVQQQPRESTDRHQSKGIKKTKQLRAKKSTYRLSFGSRMPKHSRRRQPIRVKTSDVMSVPLTTKAAATTNSNAIARIIHKYNVIKHPHKPFELTFVPVYVDEMVAH